MFQKGKPGQLGNVSPCVALGGAMLFERGKGGLGGGMEFSSFMEQGEEQGGPTYETYI